MTTNWIMKGRRGYEKVLSSTFQDLTFSSPQSETVHDLPGKVEDGPMSQQVKSYGSELYRSDEEVDVKSTESFQGLSLHETLPPVERQHVYEVDGQKTAGNDHDDSKEARYSSLPETVVSFEKRVDDIDTDDTSSKYVTPETTESQTSSSESRQPTDGSEGSGSSSLGWIPNIPVFKSIMPSSNSTHSSDKSFSPEDEGTGSVLDALGVTRKGVVPTSGSNTNLNVMENEEEVKTLTRESLQGFLYRSPEELQNYLTRIVFSQPDFGIYVSKELTPSRNEYNVESYRRDKEFTVLHEIAKQGNSCGVFVCEDNNTKHQFVWKKIRKAHNRLIGIEFLTQHDKHFLPKIYGVYKEKETISIFQEYIKGGTLLHTCWNMANIRDLAEELLLAVHYLHTQGLVHSDIKLRNLMVRDVANPQTLVLIDFESAKHSSLPFQKGGYTLTYLPPWHEKLLNLEHYDELLKTADLWAVACVIIFFLIPSPHSDLEKHGRGEVWSQELRKIKEGCQVCKKELDSGKYCPNCRKDFLHYVAENGHTILRKHLGHLMDLQSDDPNWTAVRQVLEYLTDHNNISEKHVGIALNLIKGPMCQPANECDYDTNP